MLAALLGAGSAAAKPSTPTRSSARIVGTYDVVTHATGGLVLYETFRIETFNAKTGAFRGHGNLESFGALAFSGTVKGASIEMRVTATGYVAHYRGTIQSDGMISGTMTDSSFEKGTWTMTRLTTSARPPVVVEKTGWGEDPLSHGFGTLYSWGVEVANRSATLDAIEVDVTVHVRARGVGELGGGDYTIGFLPAGQSFVIGGGSGALGAQITGVTAAVYVEALQPQPPKRNKLPTVTNLHIDRKGGVVTAQITNPYSFAINLWKATAYAVVFDKNGRIIGGGTSGPLTDGITVPSSLKPGAHMQAAVPISSPISHAASAEVSVNP